MKLKDRPDEWWKGKKFSYWCRADRNDTRKIHYTVNHRSIGQGLRVFSFTSDDEVDPEMMYWLRTGIIKDLNLIDTDWYVIIDAGIIPTA
jgi:hypothetical protein